MVPFTLILSPVVKCHERPGHADLVVRGRAWLEVEWFQCVSYLHDQFSRLEDLLVGLCIGWHGERGVLCFESVLLFNHSARQYTSKVSLHGQRSILFDVLRIVVGPLAAPSLRFLCVQLCIVGFSPAARLTHFPILFIIIIFNYSSYCYYK